MNPHAFVYGEHDPYEGVPVVEAVAPHGWGSTSPIFRDLIEEVDPRTIVEVGSWLGASAITMAKAAPNAHLYCVDTWLGSADMWQPFRPDDMLGLRRGHPTIYERFIENIVAHRLRDRVTPMPMPSADAARLFAEASGPGPCLIYIDAAHDYGNVRADIAAWDAILSRKGTIFGHDYSTNHPGVVRAVHEHYGDGVDVSHAPWWVVRPEERR